MEHKTLVSKLFQEVINPGNCFHCGLCEGLSHNLFKMQNGEKGPIPQLIRKPKKKDLIDLKKIVMACPGRGFPYNYLSKKSDAKIKSKLLGNFNSLYIASSNNKIIRKKASSGGIIRTLLIEMIKKKKIDYVCVLEKKKNKVLDFDFLKTKDISKISNLSQSIYMTTPLLHKLKSLDKNKRYCFVGLPEHIAALRVLKLKFYSEFKHIKYLIGIYAGTNMYPGAINFFLAGHNIKNINSIDKIDWRYGEWPGMLRVLTKDKRHLMLKKFYYNYLIPFFISRNSMITPDFTSELADISIGDAWSPKLEKKGHGYSVVISRSIFFDNILNNLKLKGKINIKKIKFKECINMHAHMLEFKKIGSYLRIISLKKNGPVPSYDLKPTDIKIKRKFIESVIEIIIKFSSNKIIRFFFSKFNPKFLGVIFDVSRNIWKKISKPSKRSGLNNIKFIVENNKRQKEFK